MAALTSFPSPSRRKYSDSGREQNRAFSSSFCFSCSFPGVLCGHAVDPSDGYMFAQINDGNCVALPFAKDFGWGAELKLEMIFQQLFGFGHGNGYPKERVVPEQRNKKILDGVKKVTYRPLLDILKDLDQDFVKETISGKHFAEYFYRDSKDEAIKAYLKELH